MKKITTWSIILCCALQLAAFPASSGDSEYVPSSIASVVDLTSPITAVSAVVTADNPLQTRIAPRVESLPCTETAANSVGLCLNSSPNQLKDHAQRSLVSFICPDNDVLGILQSTPPGRSNPVPFAFLLSCLLFLVVLARAHLPWVGLSFVREQMTPAFVTAGFFIWGRKYER